MKRKRYLALACGYDSSLALLWSAQDGLISRVGPNCTFASAGSVPDGQGGLLAQNTLPVITDSYDRKFVLSDVAYSNVLPSNSNDFSTGWTNTNVTVTADTDGFYKNTVTTTAATTKGRLQGATVASFVTFSVTVKRGSSDTGLRQFLLQDTTTSIIVVGGSLNYGTGGWTYSSGSTGVVITPLGNSTYFITMTCPWVSGNSLRIYCGNSGSSRTEGEYFYTKNPQITLDQYSHLYILPGTSATSTAGSTTNGQIWSTLASDPKGEKVLECLRGDPDGTEIWDDASASGTNWALSSGQWTHTAGSTAVLAITGVLTLAARYLITWTMSDRTAGTVTARAGSSGTGGSAQSTNATFTTELTCAGSTDIQLVPTSTFDGKVTVTSVQKLNPAIFTVACLVKKLVSSADLLGTNTSRVVLFPGTTSLLTYRGHSTVEASSDASVSNNGGAVPSSPATTWNRYEWHYMLARSNADGSQFQAGHQKLTDNMVPKGTDELAWGSLVNSTGTYKPGAQLISANNSAVPGGLAFVGIWKKVATDAEIIREIRRKYPIGV